jgi:hypothetical protein
VNLALRASALITFSLKFSRFSKPSSAEAVKENHIGRWRSLGPTSGIRLSRPQGPAEIPIIDRLASGDDNQGITLQKCTKVIRAA